MSIKLSFVACMMSCVLLSDWFSLYSAESSYILFPSLIAKNGVVLAVEKKQKSVLYDESSINKVCVCVRVSVCVSVCVRVCLCE